MIQERFNIVDLFFEAAEKYPDKTAIIEKEQGIAFSELSKQVKETSAHFSGKGIVKGDRVMIFVPMSIDLYRIVLALFHIGATAVFLDEWVSKKRMEECCKVAQCKAFIGIFKVRVLSLFSSELRKIPIKLGTGYSLTGAPLRQIIKTKKIDTALITFTTGSTGTPKAAKRTHGFLREQFNALLETIDPRSDDIDMPVLPIVLLINLGAGCTSVIARFNGGKQESMHPEQIFKQLKNHRINRMVASPFFVKRLAKYLLEQGLMLPSLEKIFTGGAPVFPSEAELYQRAFPEAQVEIVYGSTEAEPVSSIAIKELIEEKGTLLNKGLLAGIPYRKTKVKIIAIKDDAIRCSDEKELEKLELAEGKTGEIIVSGPHVLREYFNNKEALKQNKIFIGDNCWHRTGDSGYLKNGALYLTGRCNTLISFENTIISPFIYENYFQSMEGVEIGTIMKINNRLILLLQTKNNANRKVLEQQIRSKGLHFDDINFVSNIPRDPRHHSKIDYEKLKSDDTFKKFPYSGKTGTA